MLYEYKCTDDKCDFCDYVEHGINDDTERTCPKCGKKVRKTFTTSAPIFKGNGFYRNDYKN